MRTLDLPEGGPGAVASGKLPLRNRRTAIKRRIVLEKKWASIYLHNILRPDPIASVPHSHPRWMITICLSGGYTEELWGENIKPRQRKHRKFIPYILSPKIHHMINKVDPNTKTLCLMGMDSHGVSLWWQGQSWTWKEWVSR